jgi:hypothetical protein
MWMCNSGVPPAPVFPGVSILAKGFFFSARSRGEDSYLGMDPLWLRQDGGRCSTDRRQKAYFDVVIHSRLRHALDSIRYLSYLQNDAKTIAAISFIWK